MKLLTWNSLYRAILICCVCLFSNATAAERTFTSINKNTAGNSLGYWEFLPSEYYENPTKEFPIVIFLHGLGEGGNGSTDLHKVLRNGPPDILDTPSHPLHDLFEDEGVIVLSPQLAKDVWWNHVHIRPFVDFVLSKYRIDRRQMYLTGLSAGSQGTHSFMNNNDFAQQFAAFIPIAIRGRVNVAEGDYLSRRAAYWTLTAKGDLSYLAFQSGNNLAGFFLGTAPTDIQANYPDERVPDGSAMDRTASFDAVNGWQWEDGVTTNLDKHIKVTIFQGSSHNSWDRTYNNPNVWAWLFAQKKPTVDITSPAPGVLYQSGQSVMLSVNASDRDGRAITGANITWTSNLDGVLGTGSSISSTTLSTGVHEITCAVSDPTYHQYIEKKTTITILYSSPFTAQFDFGDASMETPGWNNLTDRIDGIVENAVDTNDTPIGVRVAITDGFDGIQTGGVAASNVYPVTVQQDTMFVANATPNAEISVSGLNPATTFDFTFFASRTASNNRTANYTINGNTTSLNAANNTTKTVSLTGITPNSSGEVTVSIQCDAAASWGYIGSMVITTTGAPSPYQIYQNTHFTAAEQLDPLISGGIADPDLDGWNNLIEYAFGSNPRQPDGNQILMTRVVGESNRNIALNFKRDRTKADLIYEVYASNDLSTWAPIARSANGHPTVDVSAGAISILETGTSPVEVSIIDATPLSGVSRYYRLQLAR